MSAPKASPPPPGDFDRRPRRTQGDPAPEAILSAIGILLTAWETLDTELGYLFDALTPTPKRLGLQWYINTEPSSLRLNMIRHQARIHLTEHQAIMKSIDGLLNDCQKLAARRNEIAHGRIFNLGEHGYSLCPSTVKNSNFPDGVFKFQYVGEDIYHYCLMLSVCRSRLHDLMRTLKRDVNTNVVLCQFQEP